MAFVRGVDENGNMSASACRYIFLYSHKTSQIMIQPIKNSPLDLGEETELYVDILCDGYYSEDEADQLIKSSPHALTEDDLVTKNHPKEPSTAPPKEKRQLKFEFLDPQLRRRFQKVIDQVPGRKEEAYRIFDFIAMSQNGATAPLCLHGNTGCGKTSLITQVMNFFQGNCRSVKVAYLNCMSMWSANHVYKGILKKLFEKVHVGGRQKKAITLNELLINGIGKNEPTKIIILDEIDQFINDQSFLYNMLEWLGLKAKVILVLISNVIDLTLKVDGKLQSRFKFETIIFKPYSYKQVENIIKFKYRDIEAIATEGVVSYIAKRVANINSDIRLLEKIYARMRQLYDSNRKRLSMNEVNGLIPDEREELPVMLASYTCILNILHKAKKKQQISSEVMHKLFIQGMRMPESKQVLLMLCQLQDYGLITLTNSRKSCDVTYYDYGIKIHESLHLLYRNDDK